MELFYLNYFNIIGYIEQTILENNITCDKEIEELYQELLINMYEFVGNNLDEFCILGSNDIKC